MPIMLIVLERGSDGFSAVCVKSGVAADGDTPGEAVDALCALVKLRAETVEAIEDAEDIAAAEAARAEPGDAIPLEQIRAGLDSPDPRA